MASTVAACVSRRKDVQAAYIFGSVASGRARVDSDIDIAVLLARRLPPARTLSYRLKLMADLGAALRRSDVEVVILNDAAPLLAHRVLARGKLVYEQSASARVRFQVQTASRYFDMIPTLEMYIRSTKQHVREGRIVG